MNVTDGDRERQARADGVYARIEVLADDLAERRAIAGFLRLQLGVQEALAHKIEHEIEALHDERNAIFHEGDE